MKQCVFIFPTLFFPSGAATLPLSSCEKLKKLIVDLCPAMGTFSVKLHILIKY